VRTTATGIVEALCVRSRKPRTAAAGVRGLPPKADRDGAASDRDSAVRPDMGGRARRPANRSRRPPNGAREWSGQAARPIRWRSTVAEPFPSATERCVRAVRTTLSRPTRRTPVTVGNGWFGCVCLSVSIKLPYSSGVVQALSLEPRHSTGAGRIRPTRGVARANPARHATTTASCRRGARTTPR
jgi:hypothetical protein